MVSDSSLPSDDTSDLSFRWPGGAPPGESQSFLPPRSEARQAASEPTLEPLPRAAEALGPLLEGFRQEAASLRDQVAEATQTMEGLARRRTELLQSVVDGLEQEGLDLPEALTEQLDQVWSALNGLLDEEHDWLQVERQISERLGGLAARADATAVLADVARLEEHVGEAMHVMLREIGRVRAEVGGTGGRDVAGDDLREVTTSMSDQLQQVATDVGVVNERQLALEQAMATLVDEVHRLRRRIPLTAPSAQKRSTSRSGGAARR